MSCIVLWFESDMNICCREGSCRVVYDAVRFSQFFRCEKFIFLLLYSLEVKKSFCVLS